MSLELQGIRKTFVSRKRSQAVLRGVDLCVEQGEFVSLIGHSGCGKSTLINIAGGLLRPDSWQSESETEIVVMVTHGIDEAILLSDRIAVLANPPHPSVVDIIPTDLPRPRDRVSVIDDPHFRNVQERLMALLVLETPEPVAV
jgi:ABC-type nitrate/sulfonate/bicarbonate transport system ATPase subunit